MDIKHIEPKRTNESRILLPTSLDYKTCVLGGGGGLSLMYSNWKSLSKALTVFYFNNMV